MTQAVVFFIAIYRRAVSPFLGNHCRFHPTCSEYAQNAFSRKGIFRGTVLSAWRVLRCNPLSSGGFDPVE